MLKPWAKSDASSEDRVFIVTKHWEEEDGKDQSSVLYICENKERQKERFRHAKKRAKKLGLRHWFHKRERPLYR